MIGKSYAKIAIVGFALCLAMVLCASFARFRSEQSFIDGAENGFGIDGMYVNDGATKPSMAILAGEDMEWQICNDDGEPAYMASTVKDRYKAFSGDTFYVAEYDTTYRQLRYNKGYDYLGAEAISYTSGWYRSNYGHITQFKCNYRVYN